MAKIKVKPIVSPITVYDDEWIDALQEAAIRANNTNTKISKVQTHKVRIIDNHKTVGHRLRRTFKFSY